MLTLTITGVVSILLYHTLLLYLGELSFPSISLFKGNNERDTPINGYVPIKSNTRQLLSKDIYEDYLPAPVEEYMIAHRCPAEKLKNRVDRSIAGVESKDELFSDILRFYDGRNRLHWKQRFMGTRMGQFPFDLQTITEILYDIKPDLIIETGTNAGGSALYMAVMMAAFNPNCRILTVDTQPLNKWQARFGGELPTDKQPWKDRVTFVQKHSDSMEFLQIARNMSASAERVLVILDSFHEAKTVWDELMQLCIPLATKGSYCIVEDSVLGTPVDALKAFWRTKESSDFCIDSDREYLGLTQHRGGYIARVGDSYKKEVSPDKLKAFNQKYKQDLVYVRGKPNINHRNQRKSIEQAVEAYLNVTE